MLLSTSLVRAFLHAGGIIVPTGATPRRDACEAKASWWFSSQLSPVQHISHQPLAMPFPTLMSTARTPSASVRYFIKTSLLLLLNFTFLLLYVLNGGFSEQVALIFYCGKVYFFHLSCMQNVCLLQLKLPLKIYRGTELSVKNESLHRGACEPQPGKAQGGEIRGCLFYQDLTYILSR